MAATEFNARLGSAGRRQFFELVTLSSGTAAVTVPCEKVDCVQVTETGGVASGDTYSTIISAPANGSTAILVDSSNGSSSASAFVQVIGY